MREIEGRTAVVAGAASGVGNAMARAFAREGMRVVLADIDERPLHAAADALRASGADGDGGQAHRHLDHRRHD